MIKPKIVAIAALGRNTRFICEGDDLLWHISDDLKRVKSLTIKHPIIMGRKTFESIGKPLPDRTNIVLTRNKSYTHEGVKVAYSPEEALKIAEGSEGGEEKIVIFGGADIYELFLPKTDILNLTLVDSEKEGTRQFPSFEKDFEKSEEHGGGIYNDNGTEVTYQWVDFERKTK